MAKMLSQAGEMTVLLKDVIREGNDLVLVGQMGVWESRIIVAPDEALAMTRLMLRPRVLTFMLSAPFRKLFHRTKRLESGTK